MNETPTLHDLLDALPSLVETHCQRRNISQRTAARELGLSSSTVTRIIQGHGMDVRAFVAIVQWLNLTAEWFDEPDEAWNAYWRGWNDCATRVQGALTKPTVGSDQ